MAEIVAVTAPFQSQSAVGTNFPARGIHQQELTCGNVGGFYNGDVADDLAHLVSQVMPGGIFRYVEDRLVGRMKEENVGREMQQAKLQNASAHIFPLSSVMV